MNRHAYLVIAHNEPLLLHTLLDALDVEWNDVFLHIDRRNASLFAEVNDIKLQKAGLFVVQNPIEIYWGHTSQVDAELLLMREATNHGSYQYYHLLSGCDLPIKSAEEIRRFFDEHQGMEFIGFWNDEAHQRDALRKVRYYYFFNRWKQRSSSRLLHMVTSPLRNLILNMQKLVGVNRQRGRKIDVKKGFNWFSITDECCRYVLSHETDIHRLFHHTLCPDEIFLQTIVWNSPFRSRLFDVDDAQRGSMRAIDWQRGNPYVWRKEDVDYLVESPYLFARKFASDDMEAVDKLTKCRCRGEHHASYSL